jgi:hypothetical protein
MTRALSLLVLLTLLGGTGLAAATTGRQAVLDHYAALAHEADPHFAAFTASAGKAFFLARPAAGGSETPSCTVCHTADPRNEGRTRAGKAISPMAVSRTPDRFADLEKVEKWFGRNCHTVYGRDCTPAEKGNFITFMASQ